MNRQAAMAGGGEPRGSKLPLKGHIKIGKKGPVRQSQGGKEYQSPMKLDHFVVTTLERDETGNFKRDDALHKVLAEEYGDKPTVLPIRFVHDNLDLNYSEYLGAWRGKTRWCFSDGASGVAQRLIGDGPNYQEVECPCERLTNPAYDKPDKCKPHGRLDCIIDGALTVGGIYRLDTTSWGTVEGLESSIDFISRITGGRLAGLPLNLTLNKQTKTNPATGKPVDVYIVGLEYRGSIEELKAGMIRQLEADRDYHVRLALIESRIPREKVPTLSEEEQAEIADEFHPDAAASAAVPSQFGFGRTSPATRPYLAETVVTSDGADNSGNSQPIASEATKIDEIGNSKTSNHSEAAAAAPAINVDEAF